RVLESDLGKVPGDEPVTPAPSRGFQRVLQRAAIHVQSSGKEELKGYNVLVAIFAEVDSQAVEVLTALGLTRYDIVSFVSHGVTKDGSDESALETSGGEDEDDEAEGGDGDGERVSDPLKKFAINLNEAAAAGHIEPLVGRDKELRRAVQVLC